MIPKGLLDAEITGNPYTNQPLINQMLHWCNVEIKYEWNTGTFDPGPNVVTTRPQISTSLVQL
jgi:hypothetical protein